MDTGVFNPRGFVTNVTYNTSNSSNQSSQRVSLVQCWTPTKIIFLGVPLRGGSRISQRGRQLQTYYFGHFFPKNAIRFRKWCMKKGQFKDLPATHVMLSIRWSSGRVPLDVTFTLATIKAFDDNIGNLVLSAENTIRSAQWTLMRDLQWNCGFRSTDKSFLFSFKIITNKNAFQ